MHRTVEEINRLAEYARLRFYASSPPSEFWHRLWVGCATAQWAYHNYQDGQLDAWANWRREHPQGLNRSVQS